MESVTPRSNYEREARATGGKTGRYSDNQISPLKIPLSSVASTPHTQPRVVTGRIAVSTCVDAPEFSEFKTA